MRNYRLTLSTKKDFLEQINEILTENPQDAVYVNVDKKKKKRSLSANAQYQVWLKQISEFTTTDLKTATAETKIDFGLPILLDDPQVGPVLGHALDSAGWDRMTREQQVKFISIIQMSSIMDTKQHNQYRENIIHYWNINGLSLGYIDNG